VYMGVLRRLALVRSGLPASSCVDIACRVGRSWTGLEVLRYRLRYQLDSSLDTQLRHYFHGFTTAPSEPRLVRVTEWGYAARRTSFSRHRSG
jgi:hypothetical protein